MAASFEDLMSLAEDNAIKGEKKIQTTTAPQFNLRGAPKKETVRDKKLSEGVRKFLARKEEEDKQKAQKERLKKERLLQLRSQDSKAKRRVNSMLNMTKSANKSCMADAKDSFSAALDEQGDFQPDEDDYGYVSQSSQAWHNKLVQKYKQNPTVASPKPKPVPPVPISKSLTASVKERRPEHVKDDYQFKAPETRAVEEPKAMKKSKKAPPPEALDFKKLMEIAGQKAKEPINFELPKPGASREKESFEFGRPMTAKEKQQYRQEQAMKERVNSLNNRSISCDKSTSSTPKQQNSAAANSSTQFRIPVKKKDEPSTSSSSPKTTSSTIAPTKTVHKNNSTTSQQKNNSTTSQQKNNSTTSQNIPPVQSRREGNPKPTVNTSKSCDRSVNEKLKAQKKHSDQEAKPKVSAQDKPREKLKSQTSLSKPVVSNHFKEPSKPLKPNLPNSVDKEPKRQRPTSPPQKPTLPPRRPPTQQRPYHPAERIPVKAKFPKRKMVLDSDEEDSDMDDFIDDSDEQLDYSAMIRSITGYDRRKFDGIDDDDIQETSVHEQWKEERRSAFIGLKEDLEDIRREKEEEERKRQKMKAKKMKR